MDIFASLLMKMTTKEMNEMMSEIKKEFTSHLTDLGGKMVTPTHDYNHLVFTRNGTIVSSKQHQNQVDFIRNGKKYSFYFEYKFPEIVINRILKDDKIIKEKVSCCITDFPSVLQTIDTKS